MSVRVIASTADDSIGIGSLIELNAVKIADTQEGVVITDDLGEEYLVYDYRVISNLVE